MGAPAFSGGTSLSSRGSCSQILKTLLDLRSWEPNSISSVPCLLSCTPRLEEKKSKSIHSTTSEFKLKIIRGINRSFGRPHMRVPEAPFLARYNALIPELSFSGAAEI